MADCRKKRYKPNCPELSIGDGIVTFEQCDEVLGSISMDQCTNETIEIPCPGDGEVTLTHCGNDIGSFTLNQEEDITLDIPCPNAELKIKECGVEHKFQATQDGSTTIDLGCPLQEVPWNELPFCDECFEWCEPDTRFVYIPSIRNNRPPGASSETPKGWHKWQSYPDDAEVDCDGKLRFPAKTSGCPSSGTCSESDNNQYHIWITDDNGKWRDIGIRNDVNGIDVQSLDLKPDKEYLGWVEATCKGSRGDTNLLHPDGCYGSSVLPGDGPMSANGSDSEDGATINAPGVFKIRIRKGCEPDCRYELILDCPKQGKSGDDFEITASVDGVNESNVKFEWYKGSTSSGTKVGTGKKYTGKYPNAESCQKYSCKATFNNEGKGCTDVTRSENCQVCSDPDPRDCSYDLVLNCPDKGKKGDEFEITATAEGVNDANVEFTWYEGNTADGTEVGTGQKYKGKYPEHGTCQKYSCKAVFNSSDGECKDVTKSSNCQVCSKDEEKPPPQPNDVRVVIETCPDACGTPRDTFDITAKETNFGGDVTWSWTTGDGTPIPGADKRTYTAMFPDEGSTRFCATATSVDDPNNNDTECCRLIACDAPNRECNFDLVLTCPDKGIKDDSFTITADAVGINNSNAEFTWYEGNTEDGVEVGTGTSYTGTYPDHGTCQKYACKAVFNSNDGVCQNITKSANCQVCSLDEVKPPPAPGNVRVEIVACPSSCGAPGDTYTITAQETNYGQAVSWQWYQGGGADTGTLIPGATSRSFTGTYPDEGSNRYCAVATANADSNNKDSDCCRLIACDVPPPPPSDPCEDCGPSGGWVLNYECLSNKVGRALTSGESTLIMNVREQAERLDAIEGRLAELEELL